MLILGCVWAGITLQEYKEGYDKPELKLIRKHHFGWAVATTASFFIYFSQMSATISLLASIVIVAFGWAFVFTYELGTERQAGLIGGPGVPFLSRKVMAKLRQKIKLIKERKQK